MFTGEQDSDRARTEWERHSSVQGQGVQGGLSESEPLLQTTAVVQQDSGNSGHLVCTWPGRNHSPIGSGKSEAKCNDLIVFNDLSRDSSQVSFQNSNTDFAYYTENAIAAFGVYQKLPIFA